MERRSASETNSVKTSIPSKAPSMSSCTSNSKETNNRTPDPLQKPRPEIAPNGEVILLVGPDSHAIRVHALILADASPVFKCLLKPTSSTYTEPAAVLFATPDSPAHVTLPEDDPQAIETICRVLHSRIDDAVCDLSDDEVLMVAMAADKYDCTAAMGLAVRHWLRADKLEAIKNAARDGCIGFRRGDMLLAAYWFKCDPVFEELTRLLVTSTVGGFEALVDGRDGPEEVLACRLSYALEKHRNALRFSLWTVITDRMYEPVCLPWNVRLRPQYKRNWFGARIHVPPLPGTPDLQWICERLQAWDRKTFVTGYKYMSVDDALCRAVRILPAAFESISGLRKMYNPDATSGCHGDLPWYKQDMQMKLNKWKRESLTGVTG
ncbi:BTB/POZ domain-containing protein [Colletotrichum kahawae]|uniref:BTB/POZ domain-containing protein n=1 Tax=Colletotrichum kahawae TaxID=34407 RepID=A0AAD9Y431_COLKA|nr:BTB/POZ domain-containing protein [Colletotrichum kahawae]